jgi:hypothetical protein
MKLLLPLFLSPHERQQMLGLLPENLREHQEVARLDSSYQNYREIAANVLLMYGGKSNMKWVDLATERLASRNPKRRNIQNSTTSGSTKRHHEKSPRQSVNTF